MNLEYIFYRQIVVIFKYCGAVDYTSGFYDYDTALEYLEVCGQLEELQWVAHHIRGMVRFLTLLYDMTDDCHEYELFRTSIVNRNHYDDNSFDDAITALKGMGSEQLDLIPLTTFATGMIKQGYQYRHEFKKALDKLSRCFV